MKSFKLVLYGACFLVIAHTGFSLTPVMAASSSAAAEVAPYQSAFDGYKPFVDENLSSWESVNKQSSDSGHTGHSMGNMKHEMSPEEMKSMPADTPMPAMEGMDHAAMKAMPGDASKAATQAPVKRMNDDHMKSMPADLPMSATQEMNHDAREAMPEDSVKPVMKEMNHGEMNSMTDDSSITEQANQQNDEHHHSHSQVRTQAKVEVAQFEIIPNLHPIAVHFPIVLTLIAFLFSLAAYIRRSHALAPQLAATGHFTLWLAAITAATAVLFGWLAFNSVNHDDAGHAAMLLHRAWAIPTAIGLVLLACWDAWKHRVNALMPILALALLFLLSGAIAVTGWLGGEVVYRHGIGVLSLPASEGTGHSHHHDHGGAESAEHSHATPETEPDEHTEHHHDDENGEAHEH